MKTPYLIDTTLRDGEQMPGSAALTMVSCTRRIYINHRGCGIGTALLNELEQWARQRGLGRLQLQADQDNHPALGFYRRSGWTRTHLIGWMKTLD